MQVLSMYIVRRISGCLALFCAAMLLFSARAYGLPAPVQLRGYVVTADGEMPRGLRLIARSGAFADSVEIDSSGRFTLAVPASAGTVELLTDAVDRTNRRYLPSLVRITADQLTEEQRFVLIPTRWKVSDGRFAGRSVDINLQQALVPSCVLCSSFYRPARLASGATRIQTWRETSYPLRVALDRSSVSGRLTARDSIVMWRALADLQEDLGAGLFRPASYWETLPDEDNGPFDVVLVWFDPRLAAAGVSVTVLDRGDITYAGVRFKRSSMLADIQGPGLISHEFLHALGFGHTCAWRSLMADPYRCAGNTSPTATLKDVAYIQLLLRTHALQREHEAQWGIEAALAGERSLAGSNPQHRYGQ